MPMQNSNILKFILIFMLLFAPAHSFASDYDIAIVLRYQGESIPFNNMQIDNLKFIWHTAQSLPNQNGETWHYTLTSIAIRESSAGMSVIGDIGRNAPMTQGSYGLFHFQLATIKDVFRHSKITAYSHLTDTQLINKMTRDRTWATYMAIAHMNWLDRNTNSYFQMVSRWNGGNANRPYYNAVMRDMELVKMLERAGIFN